MKIKKSWIVIMMAAAAMLTACSRDLTFDEKQAPQAQPGGEAGQSESDLVPVMFTLSEKVAFTRAAATNIMTFDSNEPIKVCVKPYGAESYTPYTYTTAAAGQSEVTLTAPETPPYFPVAAPHTVQAYAYYPATASSDGTTPATFTVQANQVSDDDYKASDLMYAADRTITKGISEGTNLSMAHLMAQLHLNVSAVGLSVHRVLVHACPSVTFAPATGEVALTEAEAIDIVAATAAGEAYVCIPEQPINTVTVKVETGAQGDAATTATFTFTSEASFTAGDTHPLTLTLTAAQLGATSAIADWNGQQAVTIAPSGDLDVEPIDAVTYNGSAQTPSLTVKKGSTTLTAGTDYDVEWHNNTNAGTAIAVILGKGSTYLGSVAVAKFTINKADVTLTAPTKKTSLTYNSSAQALVNAGTVTGGTLKYKLDNGDYGTSVPTAINANPTTGYSVTYYVEGDANHNSTDPVTISGITIAKKSITSSDITLATQTLTYNGSSQTRNIASVAGMTDASYWSVTGNTGTNASESYSMTVTMTDNCQNYTGSATKGWSIGKASTSVTTAPTKADNWTANGSAHNLLATAGAASSGGTMYYYSSTTNSTPATSASGWTSTIPQATTAGTYYVWYYSKGDSNHSDSSVGGPLTITVSSPYTMASAATASDVGKVICSNGHIHATVSAVTCGGTASAMIAYVGSSNNSAGSSAYSSTFNHGLAVALTDVSNTSGAEGSSTMTWANAGTAASAYTRARSTTYTSAWFLPSAYQWERILIGCGGTTSYTTSLSDGMSFSYGNFRTKLTTCGGTDVRSRYYWSSTEYNSANAWLYYFSLSTFGWSGKTGSFYVRAVLAF